MKQATQSWSPTLNPGFRGGLSVGLLFSHNSSGIDYYMVLSRVTDVVLSGYNQTCMHELPNKPPHIQDSGCNP
jgi:hypothetical protein